MATTRTRTTAVTYCRISADKYGTEAGVDRQQHLTDQLAAEHDLEVVERIVDNDRSASKYARKSREGFDRLLQLLDDQAVDAVVAYDLDRISRRPADLEPLIVAAERGVRIYTASGSALDLATDDGVLQARLLLAFAEKEAANASRRQKAKLRRDAELGRPHWPKRPFGFTMTAEHVPAEAAVLREIYARIIDGESCTAIASDMNARTVAQPSGKPWQSSSVKLMVSNPRNAGLRAYKGEIVGPAAWEPIVSEDDWRAAVAALQLRARPKKGGSISMLTGLVRCGRCGEQMYRTGADTRAEYRCAVREHNSLRAGCRNSMRAHHVDRLIVEMVLVRLGDVVGRRRERTVSTGADEAAMIRADLDELAAMVGRGEMTMTEWKAARAPLQDRLRAAEAVAARDDTEAALDRLAGDGARLADRWDDLDVEHRNRIMRLVLDRVEIGPSVSKRLDLDRITPVWIAG